MNTEFWVFGYGSLMWNPGFTYAERQVAELEGYRRRFCLDSIMYRGTPEAPGLVLALDQQAAARCAGVAFRVTEAHAAAAYAYLTERELVTSAYAEATKPVCLIDGRVVDALCYVSVPEHPQYRSGLGLDDEAAIIARSRGPAGSNSEYLFQTLEQLRAHDIRDDGLEQLEHRVRALLAEMP